MKMNYEYDTINYLEYEKKCLEIFDYFNGLCVIEKLCGKNNIKINIINDNPLFYDIVFKYDKNYLILRNYSIVKNQYIPQFNCIMLFNVSWEKRMNMLNGNYTFGGLNNKIKYEYENFYRCNFEYNYLEFKKIDISSSMNTMSDDVRIEYYINDISLDKLLYLKEIMEVENEKG